MSAANDLCPLVAVHCQPLLDSILRSCKALLRSILEEIPVLVDLLTVSWLSPDEHSGTSPFLLAPRTDQEDGSAWLEAVQPNYNPNRVGL